MRTNCLGEIERARSALAAGKAIPRRDAFAAALADRIRSACLWGTDFPTPT